MHQCSKFENKFWKTGWICKNNLILIRLFILFPTLSVLMLAASIFMKCLSRSSNTLTMYSSLTLENIKESLWFLYNQALWPLKVVKFRTVQFRAEPTFRKAERFASSRPVLDKGPGDGNRNCGPRWAETPISLHFGASVTPIRPAGRKNPGPPSPHWP